MAIQLPCHVFCGFSGYVEDDKALNSKRTPDAKNKDFPTIYGAERNKEERFVWVGEVSP